MTATVHPHAAQSEVQELTSLLKRRVIDSPELRKFLKRDNLTSSELQPIYKATAKMREPYTAAFLHLVFGTVGVSFEYLGNNRLKYTQYVVTAAFFVAAVLNMAFNFGFVYLAVVLGAFVAWHLFGLFYCIVNTWKQNVKTFAQAYAELENKQQ